MGKEIKLGDWVKVSDENEDDAQQTSDLYRATKVNYDGRVIADDLMWAYAVHPDDLKVLPMDEYKSLIENQMPSIENLEVGQELNPYQVLKWIEKYGSASGLQYRYLYEWADCEGTLNNVIDTQMRYRVSPKKVNNPDDPATWEEGVAIFVRDSEQDSWILDVFSHYKRDVNFKYCSGNVVYKYAKLATPEQIEAWKLINEDL